MHIYSQKLSFYMSISFGSLIFFSGFVNVWKVAILDPMWSKYDSLLVIFYKFSIKS